MYIQLTFIGTKHLLQRGGGKFLSGKIGESIFVIKYVWVGTNLNVMDGLHIQVKESYQC